MSRSEEQSGGDDGGITPLVAGFGGFLTIATGLSITVLAFVLVSTVAGGNFPIAAISILGILAGMGIYYVGMDELFRSEL